MRRRRGGVKGCKANDQRSAIRGRGRPTAEA